MSIAVSAASVPYRASQSDANRRSANYSPSIWGDYFLSSTSNFKETNEEKIEHQNLKEQVKAVLSAKVEKHSKIMEVIDAIQRLGISYHFESEIINILGKIHISPLESENDLYSLSLRFRLLRQHGFRMSSGVFEKFMDNEGKFKDFHKSDAKGILSLYEAAHLGVLGDEILDEALAFTAAQLESLLPQLEQPLSRQVSHALKQSTHRGLPRLEAAHYFPIYQQDASRNEILLRFAKLDFNLLQKLHRLELADITRWWRELDFSNKLPFARDRIVECYFWILGVYFQPQYSSARKLLTKVIAITSIIDDVYDVYGEIQELEPLTNAIQRWDISCFNTLPEYMKILYKALLDTYEEIHKALEKQGRSEWICYARKTMIELVGAYFAEAKWFHERNEPTMEEYMQVSLVSCGYDMLTITCYVVMGDVATEEALQWLQNSPQILKSLSVICRLMDDIVTHEVEQERGDVASAVECHMKKYGVSEEEACKELRRQISSAWKDINEGFLRPAVAPLPLLNVILNLARVMDVVYKDGDGYTNSKGEMKNYISSLLLQPLPL